MLGLLYLVLLSLSLSHADAHLLPIVVRSESSSVTVQVPLNPQNATLDEVLRSIPGLTVMRSGGLGQPSSVFIRGASGDHTLVLLDGVEINDASLPGGGLDFSTLDLNLIERIEVFKGPQALRFGSGAMGGVINLITRSGPGGFWLSGRAGAYRTNQQSISYLGAEGASDYAISVSRLESEGFSAAAIGSEADGLRQHSASLKLGRRVSEKTRVDFTTRLLRTRTDLDFGPGGMVDDPYYHARSSRRVSAVGLGHTWSERWSSEARVAHSDLHRKYRALAFREDHAARTTHIENTNTYRPGEKWNLTFGPAFRRDSARRATSLLGFFVNAHSERDGFFLDIGGREDVHSEFGLQPSYAVAPGFSAGGTRVSGRLATGFKAPSLFQLFDPTFGNEQLRPERVRTAELTMAQSLGSMGLLSLTGFRNEFRELIQFTTRYENVEHATTDGVELEGEAYLSAATTLRMAFTYTDTRLLRRPRQSWRAELETRALKNLELRLGHRGMGDRADIDAATGARTTASAFDVLEAAANYSLGSHWQLHMNIENALNRKYQEVAGYGASGLAVYFGVAFTP